MSDQRLGILEQRRIEAAFAKGVYDEMKVELGEEQAKAILTRAVVKLAKQTASEMAKEGPGGKPSLDHFIALQSLWTKDDALRIDPQERDATHYAFNVTRCRYAEMYRDMGLGEIGHLLSCQRDGSFCEGYDPKLKMKRSQTIMQGASHCDFRYGYDSRAASASNETGRMAQAGVVREGSDGAAPSATGKSAGAS